MTPQDAEDPQLLQFISAALEMYDQGIDPPLVEICEGRPDLVPEVARAIGLAERLPQLQIESPLHDGLQGRVLDGRYRLKSRIGAGSMGVVYRADDLELNREVAIKVLRAEILTAGEALRRFEREAEVLAAVHHPGVVTVYDRGRTEGCSFLVMELLRGVPLSDLLEAAKVGHEPTADELRGWRRDLVRTATCEDANRLREAVAWIADLAGGLAAVHQAGIYHRDIKPSNIFVREDGKPALIDFGIATREDHATLMLGEGALGTPAYMAPESLDTRRPATAALDVYGLTATLYHLLTRRAPYSGTPSQVLSILAHMEPPPAAQRRPGLPRDLRAILDKGMARRPRDRYARAADLEEDLRAFLDYRPVKARPIGPLGRVWRRWSRKPVVRAAAAILVVLSVALGAFAYRQHDVARRRTAYDALWRGGPLSLTLWTPTSRHVEDPVYRRELSEWLDELVELDVEPVTPHLLRGAFALDQGDLAQSRRDMLAVADAVGGEYARELARRYELDASREPATPIEMEGLPEPTTPLERYLHAYHLLRGKMSRSTLLEADELLATEGAEVGLHASELHLQTRIGLARRAADEEARLAAYQAVFEDALRLEARMGGPSTTTVHVRGGALIGQKRYADTRDLLLAGIEARPDAQGFHSNLAIAQRRLGDFERAVASCRRAIEMRPDDLNAHETLFRSLAGASRLAEARTAIESAPWTDSSSSQRTRARWLAELSSDVAIQRYSEGRLEEARAAASESLQHYASIGYTATDRPQAALAQAILDDDMNTAFDSLLVMLRDEPTNWAWIRQLLLVRPNTLDAEQTELACGYWLALVKRLAPYASSQPTPLPTPSQELDR